MAKILLQSDGSTANIALQCLHEQYIPSGYSVPLRTSFIKIFPPWVFTLFCNLFL
jgi:hypothetical protein